MNKKLVFILGGVFVYIASLFCQSCAKPQKNKSIPLPSNLQIQTVVIGANSSNVDGDGSGNISFTIQAKDVAYFKIAIDNDTIHRTTPGTFNYIVNKPGIHQYSIVLMAYNSKNQYTQTTTQLKVYVKETNLLWSDEFNINGAPDNTKWTYDIGRGDNGWGNNEAQYYTDNAKNVIVENGYLKITAIKENYQGASYTSTRLKSQGKYSATYGTVEVRAKLPQGGGTWPAIWMLGNDISTIGWPSCGEIDIMEHVGNTPNKIYGTLHYPGRSGGNANGTTYNITNATTDFHIYKLQWTPTQIIISVDNVPFFTFANNASTPFNNPFFFILNIAMGGGLGGQIDPSFTQSSMYVDYIRLYR